MASLTGRRRIRLLVDTFDLVVREDNADDASYLLDRLSNHCDLVITRREREWRDYLENSRVVARSLYRMPRLTADDIRLWAGEYVTSIAA